MNPPATVKVPAVCGCHDDARIPAVHVDMHVCAAGANSKFWGFGGVGDTRGAAGVLRVVCVNVRVMRVVSARVALRVM